MNFVYTYTLSSSIDRGIDFYRSVNLSSNEFRGEINHYRRYSNGVALDLIIEFNKSTTGKRGMENNGGLEEKESRLLIVWNHGEATSRCRRDREGWSSRQSSHPDGTDKRNRDPWAMNRRFLSTAAHLSNSLMPLLRRVVHRTQGEDTL